MSACSLCKYQIDVAKDQHLHMACGHHLCPPCYTPLLRKGQAACCVCPELAHADYGINKLGNLVFGNDSAQNKLAATMLRTERPTTALPAYAPVVSGTRTN